MSNSQHYTVKKIDSYDNNFSFQVRSTREYVYDVLETPNLFDINNTRFLESFDNKNTTNKRCFLVIDSKVDTLYGKKIEDYLVHHKIDFAKCSLDVCEQNKTSDQVFKVVDELNTFHIMRRSEPLVAIGGGLTTDIASLAANLYRRGMPYIKIPTTLMGIIDAGIGIKTGVNFKGHKNKIGTYHIPKKVFLDLNFLQTLDERHLINAVAEIIKIALVKDYNIFQLLENNINSLVSDKFAKKDDYIEIIKLSVVDMLEELACNLWEEDLERLVDYGHSFSPRIEMKATPQLLHGEAVAVDMAFSLLLAETKGLLTAGDCYRALNLIKNYKLPLTHEICTPVFLNSALQDIVLHRNGLMRMPLTKGIGDATFVNDVTLSELETAVRKMDVIKEQLSYQLFQEN